MSNKLVICSSGFDSQVKLEIMSKVESLGAVYMPDLTRDANVLVSKLSDTQKCKTAEEVLNIPIVTLDWVLDSHEKRKLLQNYEKYRVKIFTGMIIWTFPPMKVNALIKANGGTLTKKYCHGCSVIVSNEDKLPTLMLFNYSAPIVTEQWVKECDRLKRRLDFDEFQIRVAESPRADEKLFLSSCVVYLHQLSEADHVLQRNLIIGGGGTYSAKLIPLVSHVVANEPVKTHAKVVTQEWLKECCIQEQKLPADQFKIQPKTSA